MICKFCGNQMDDDSVFCNVCGHKVDEVAAQQEEQPQQPQPQVAQSAAEQITAKPKKKPKIWLIVLLSVFGTAILAVVGFIAYVIISVELEDGSSVEESASVETQSVSEDATETTGSDKSLDDLIALLDETQEYYMESLEKMNTEDVDFPLIAEVAQETEQKLGTYHEQAQGIEGLDPTVSVASDAFYETLTSSMQSLKGIAAFSDQYDKLTDTPDITDYETISDHYEALYSWYKEKKEEIDGVTSVPSCVEAQWNTFKKDFEMNSEIVAKEYLAEELGDYLRFSSAINMSDRYGDAVLNNMDAMNAGFDDELWFTTMQFDAAHQIMEEIKSYSELDEAGRTQYEFKNIHKNELYLDYECIDTIYPSLYSTYDSFAIIKTGCINGNHKIVVEAEIEGLTQKYKQSFDIDSSYKSIFIKPPALTGDINLSSAKDGQMVISVYEQDGSTLIESKTFPVVIKSKNDFEWTSDAFGVSTADNILSFLTPESKAISALKRTAIDELIEMTDGNIDGIVGYQYLADDEDVAEGLAPEYLADEITITYLQAAAIMRALNVEGVRYNLDGFSVSGSDQHILLPKEVLEQKSGLCIETALVVASALQSADMHVFLVFPPGHAQVAVETWDESGDYLLIETTAVSDTDNSQEIFIEGTNSLIDGYVPDGPISFLNTDEWQELLQSTDEDGEYEYYIVDCNDAQILGLTPFAN